MKTKIILLSAFVPLVIISSFLLNDLEISKSLYNPENNFAIFIQQYGELPGVFVLAIASTIWGFNNKSYQSKFRILIIITSALVTTFLILYSIYMIFFYLINPLILFNQYKIAILIPVLFFLLIYVFLLSFINFNSAIKIKTFAKTTLLTGLLGYCLFVQPLKIFWGRIRFRNLDALYSNFSDWYLPNGINGNQSFPSGHAAMGFMLLPLLILVWNKKPIIKSLVIALVCMWGILVCLSRIVIGAHYATDVLFGSASMIIAFLISTIIIKNELTILKTQ
jgi:membrane-associated phospholipid phosphatase